MARKDPRIDAYIANSADFAKPILKHIRATVHEACPDVEETMKWSFPHFDYKGMMCSMASFKQHCAFGFWKASLIFDVDADKNNDAMGHFGRITRVDDLAPKKKLLAYIAKAVKLNEEGVKLSVTRKAKPKASLDVPADLLAALKKNAKAKAAFDGFSPSHRREYIAWITSAKRDETRLRRLERTLEQLARGQSLNWKYET